MERRRELGGRLGDVGAAVFVDVSVGSDALGGWRRLEDEVVVHTGSWGGVEGRSFTREPKCELGARVRLGRGRRGDEGRCSGSGTGAHHAEEFGTGNVRRQLCSPESGRPMNFAKRDIDSLMSWGAFIFSDEMTNNWSAGYTCWYRRGRGGCKRKWCQQTHLGWKGYLDGFTERQARS